MARLRLAIRFAYTGRFGAYARRSQGDSVEDHLLAALEQEGHEAGSFRTGSRTDAGVAAYENVVACTVERPHLKGFCPAVQAHLPPGIWMRGAARVEETFNPRHASGRRYAYHAAQEGEDTALLAAAMAAFEGTHDVRAFARLESGRQPCRTVTSTTVERLDGGHVIRVEGPSFLWNQVRRMVGAALPVARGEVPVSTITDALVSGRPHRRFGLAPAEGLVLERVGHDVEWDPSAGPFRASRAVRFWQTSAAEQALAMHLRRGD